MAIRNAQGQDIPEQVPENLFTFTGREIDRTTGLMYYRARWFDTDLRRFLSEDPVWGTNLYSYVGNNPITRVDPLGLFFTPETIWDAANVAYDIYTGDAANLAIDLASMATPGVPAGSGRLAKGAVEAGEKIGKELTEEVVEKGVKEGAEETFEILDGVRRSKAKQITKKPTITADILDKTGQKKIGTKEIPIDSLRSPKTHIEVTGSEENINRFERVMKGTRDNSPHMPNIQVRPGNQGIPIKDVRFK